jgi:hypothetical protein
LAALKHCGIRFNITYVVKKEHKIEGKEFKEDFITKIGGY